MLWKVIFKFLSFSTNSPSSCFFLKFILFFLVHKHSLCLWACHFTEIIFYVWYFFCLISKYLTLENMFERSKITFESDIWNIQTWHSVNILTFKCFLCLLQLRKGEKVISRREGEGGSCRNLTKNRCRSGASIWHWRVKEELYTKIISLCNVSKKCF